MRIAIHFDGATTDAVRELAVALHRVGLTEELAIGCDGPELWSGRTPKMHSSNWARVATELIKLDGQPITRLLERHRHAALDFTTEEARP